MTFKFTPIKEVKIEKTSSQRSALYDYTFPGEEYYVHPYTSAERQKEIKVLEKKLTKLKNNQ